MNSTSVMEREPCIDCGTTGGIVLKGRDHPFRSKGRCKRCCNRISDAKARAKKREAIAERAEEQAATR